MSNEITRKFLEEEYYGWRCAERTLEKYLKCCELSTKMDKYFDSFKTNADYTPILEHVTREQSNIYFQNIIDDNIDLIYDIESKFSSNDLIGSPKIFSYKLPCGNTIACSPTTIRYVKVLSDLIKLFGSLEGLVIVEIGGGYGGLATIISKMFNLKHYYDVDLEWPGKLSKKYTSTLGVNNFTNLKPNQISDFEKIDLVISNYAFSECNFETRKEYIDNIFSKSTMGYITHNGDDNRRNETKEHIKDYKNFNVFGHDGKKNHPIFTWDKREG